MKEVFIFGAGASYASARIPLGKDLVWNYFYDCSTWYQVEGGKPTLDDLNKKGKEFINFGEFLRLADSIFPELHEYDNWMKCMKETMMYSPPTGFDKKYYVDEIIRILQRESKIDGIELIRQLTLEHITGNDRSDRGELYEKFTKRLIGKSPEDIQIISFNFDCLLQESFRDEVYLDYLLNFDTIDNNRASYNKQNGIPLIKLNGSLDWATCPKCKKIKLLTSYVGKYTYASLYCNMSQDCGEKLKPFIFLPHENKTKSINVLWDRAKNALEQASKLTIIGYSFPYYDREIIKLFKEYTNRDVELIVVDHANNQKKEEVEESIGRTIKQIFSPKNDAKVFLYGFQGYLK